MRKRRPDAHAGYRNEHRDKADCGGAARPILQFTLGFQNQPSGAEEPITEHQRQPGCEWKWRQPIERGAGKFAAVDIEALDECAKDDALGKRRHQRAAAECAVPESPHRRMFEAEFEGDTAENQRQQHHQDREIDRRNDDGEGEGKGRQ